MNLTGNTIIITGGTSGIGRELAERLAGRGNTVVTCGRRKDRLQEIAARHPEVATFACDVADEAERNAFFEWVKAAHPSANVLINNAGIQNQVDLAKPVDVARIRSEVETNLVAPIHFVSLFASLLSGKPGAAIVNISSGLGFCPIARVPIYCATKAAIHSVTLSTRRQLKDLGIAVYEVIPPTVDSELGKEHRAAPIGVPVKRFVEDMLKALEGEELELAIGEAQGLYTRREALFPMINR